MTWTVEQIEREWFGGQPLQMPPKEVEGAFAVAEQVRGREWVLGTEFDLGGLSMPGLGRRGGFSQFVRVYWFGRRMQTLLGALGANSLIQRLLNNDPAAESELTAIHLLGTSLADSNIEIAPEVVVGNRMRRPDFRIRRNGDSWTYVEVTQLNQSEASIRVQDILTQIVRDVMSVLKPFLLEIVLWREPTEGEGQQLVKEAHEACNAAAGLPRNVSDVASILVKSGDASVVIPSILPDDDGTRMAVSQSIVRPGQPNRQIVARVPFTDQRAEAILKSKVKQLPKDESTLIMVDVAGQPTAFDSWGRLVPSRFTPNNRTRVGGVLLFMTAMTGTVEGVKWLPYLKLIPNPHARRNPPTWIAEVVEQTRAETRRLTGRPD